MKNKVVIIILSIIIFGLTGYITFSQASSEKKKDDSCKIDTCECEEAKEEEKEPKENAEMLKINASQASMLFESQTPQVIYFGRPNCGACNYFQPTMLQVQTDLGFTTNYVNINLINKDNDLTKLLSKMDIETEVEVHGEIRKGTYGELYGITPTIIIVKDGKMIDGMIGSTDYATYKEFLTRNGL